MSDSREVADGLSRGDISELTRLVGELKAEVGDLRGRLAQLEGSTMSPEPSVTEAATATALSGGELEASADQSLGRRRFLSRAAVAAAGATAGAAAVAIGQPDVAAAANGDAIVAGGINTSTVRTVLQTSGTPEYGIGVLDNGLGQFAFKGAVSGHAKEAYDAAVYGQGDNRFGVLGRSTNAKGVYGVDTGTGQGVFGISATGDSVYGYATASFTGNEDSPAAIRGLALGGSPAARFQGDRTLLLQTYLDHAPPPERAGQGHLPGQLAVSWDIAPDNSTLWFNTEAGVPGTWRKVAGPETAGQLHVLPATQRIYDSRSGFAPIDVTKGALAGGQERVIDCTKDVAVPAGATAALVNLTIISGSAQGFLAAFKNGLPWPGNSSVNWDHGGQITANSAVVALDPSARFKVRASNAVDFIVDVIGYYR